MKTEVQDRAGMVCTPHRHDDADPDRFGKTHGYRVTPPPSSGDQANLTTNGVYPDTIEDGGAMLRLLPKWGVRMRAPGKPASIFTRNIMIDGAPR